MAEDPYIVQLTQAYGEAKRQIDQLEKLAKRMKEEIIEPLDNKITAWMDANGLLSLPIDKTGTFKRVRKLTYTCIDEEALSQFQFNTMEQAKREGRPLMDAMIWQKSVKQSNVERILNGLLRQMYPGSDEKTEWTPEHYNMVGKIMGIGLVETTDTRFYKSN